MTLHENFCVWLQGYLDALDTEGAEGLSDSQLSVISSKLYGVLGKERLSSPPMNTIIYPNES